MTLPPAINNGTYSIQKAVMKTKQQLEETCSVNSCGGHQILHFTCKAKCQYKYDGAAYEFIHRGIHNHGKPIVKKMTNIQKQRFNQLVAQNPEKLPSKMVTPEFIEACGEPCVNTGFVGYHRRGYLDSEEAKDKGVLKSKSYGDSWPEMFDNLTEEWEFVDVRRVHKTSIYSFRKQCMEEWLEDVLEQRIAEGTQERCGNEGMCADATFSYFKLSVYTGA